MFLHVTAVAAPAKLVRDVLGTRLNNPPHRLSRRDGEVVDHDRVVGSAAHTGHWETRWHPIALAVIGDLGLGALQVEGHLSGEHAGGSAVGVHVDRRARARTTSISIDEVLESVVHNIERGHRILDSRRLARRGLSVDRRDMKRNLWH